MKTISVITPCYNEAENIEILYARLRAVFRKHKKYRFEQIFIDNNSTDASVEIIKKLAAKDKTVKLIVNARNFGHIRSPFYGLLQGKGDAVIGMASDLQDPPELITEFIKKWEEGYKVVIGVKSKSRENPFVFYMRTLYYRFLKKFSDVDQVENFTGFGLYDKVVMDSIRRMKDPYPYFRGMIAEIGFERAVIEFTQPRRERGKTKTNLYVLYDLAMLGFVNYSKIPLRIAVFSGFFLGVCSFLISLAYLIYKLIYWDRFQLGVAPLIIGFFFIMAVQMVFIGILGEYVAAVYTQVKDRPLVIEKERINFDR